MAIANPDGSVIIDSSLNTDGIKKGFQEVNKFAQMSANEQRRLAQSLSGVYRKQGLTQSEAQKKAWQELKNGTVAAQEYEEALKDVETQSKKTTVSTKKVGTEGKKSFDGLQASLKKLLSYFIGFQTVLQAIRFSGASAEFATQTEASVQRLVDIYGSASDSVGNFIDANARALGMSKAAAASFSSVYGNLFSVWADQETNAELTNRYLNMTAVVASKTGRTVEDVQERIRSGLLGNTEAIEDLGIFVNIKTIEMTDAFQRMANGKSWEQLDAYTQQQIRSMAILEQATAKYGDEVANTSATIRNRFNAAYQDFQNSWGNIVNTVLLPVLQTLTQIFDIATKGLNALSGRSGQILENVELQEENTDKTAENIEQQAENQKDLNKEMKKTLAGFDDIQILSANTAENTSGGGVDGGIQGIGGDLGGNVPDGSAYVNEANETLGAIMGIVGFSLAALGIILLCFGQIGWGLGFLIAGAGIFAASQAALSEGETEAKSKNMLDAIVAIASGALLALGIILLFTPASLPLAIGLIIAGAAGLATEAAINWDLIVEKMRGRFGKIMAIVSAGVLVLGILLLFVPGAQGLAFGLILAGAAGLATVAAFNWESIVDWVKKAWDAVKSFWKKYIAPVFTAKFWLDLAKVCGNGLITGFEAVVNGIIWLFEGMINFVINGLNLFLRGVDAVIEAVGNVFGQDWSVATIPNVKLDRISIPRLAQGAVIPPNREFLAVLGDQKQGTNIEAPLQTIVDAFNIALSQNGGIYGASGNTEVVLEIDGREFGRAVVEQGNRENRRIGTRLVIV